MNQNYVLADQPEKKLPRILAEVVERAEESLQQVIDRMNSIQREAAGDLADRLQDLREERRTVMECMVALSGRLQRAKSDYEDDVELASSLRSTMEHQFAPLAWLMRTTSRKRKLLEITERRAAIGSKLLKLGEIRQGILIQKCNELTSMMSSAIAESPTPEALQQIGDMQHERDRLRKELAEKRNRAHAVEEKLPEVSQEAIRLEKQLAKLHERSDHISAIEQKLAEAKSPRDRKEAHLQCEKLFGSQRPWEALRGIQSEIRRTESSLKKVEARLLSAFRKASLTVTSVIIDGSNLCYLNGKFVGLGPLLGLAPVLARRWPLIIVFDKSIERLLGKNSGRLADAFADTAEVHVMRSCIPADEFILDLADTRNSVVVSMDGFAEFIDKAAVKERRVVKPEIFSGLVKIADLDIVAKYAPQPESRVG